MDSGGPSGPHPPPKVRTYKKTPAPLPIPSLPPPPPSEAASYRPLASIQQEAAHSLVDIPNETPEFPHSQPRLRAVRQNAAEKESQKFEKMEELLKNLPFDNLGDFLAILFHNRPHGEPDRRGTTHSVMVARFLHGLDSIRMSDILPLIYHHRSGYPSINSTSSDEQNLMFATHGSPDDIRNARPYMSTWATRLVAVEVRRQVGRLTKDDPADPTHHVHLRAATNERSKAHVVTWRDLGNWSLKKLESRYWRRGAGDLAMFITEAAAAPAFEDGVAVVRARRPHPIIQINAIASFIISRNRYANGELAMILGVWHFACKSHVDVKRIYCRFGNSVADSTSRNAITSMTAASLEEWRSDVRVALEGGKMPVFLILDNVQEYFEVNEQGIGRHNELKVGTAGTSIMLDECAPGAFDAKDHHERVAKNERRFLTPDALFDDLDLTHIGRVMPLHWARVLVESSSHFEPLLKAIATLFRTSPIAKRRMREGRKMKVQPLGTNGERSTETQGMERAIEDFEHQMGLDLELAKAFFFWIRGDGASYANILRLTKYCAPIGTFTNKVSTPEIWHTGATDLNSTSENHYGPATCSDPSSLSKCSSTAGLKRPSNIKSCDYYPTVRNLTLIWTAHVLDCWRVFFGVEDLHAHIESLATKNELPDLDAILRDAKQLTERYTSQAAILRSLSARTSINPALANKIPKGSPWVPPVSTPSSNTGEEDSDMPGLADIVEGADAARPPPPSKDSDAPKVHEEKDDFDGDRVLRNSQIFLTDFGWWIEFASAVPEGDIGRVWEIMKLWIFKFAGSSHQNYMSYLLEVYCLLRYESSDALRDTILDHWLLNLSGELGKWIPGDLLQEHYNRWLEDMIQRHGGEFDNKFYRQTISPNVDHFLRMKEEIETAFSLKRRSKTHTSPHQRDELRLLLTMFKEEEVHLFREGRSMGHAAVNQFARGVRRLEAGKLKDWLDKSSCVGDFIAEIHRLAADTPAENPVNTPADNRNIAMRPESEPPIMNEPNSHFPRPPSSQSTHSTSSESSRSTSSNESSGSAKSFVSELGAVDPNEPEDDGDDRSGCRLASGSAMAMWSDPETARMEHFDEGYGEREEEEENSEDPVGQEEEIPDPKINPYLDEEQVV
ncbi:hypothetical protein B0H16DRAFT_1794341 [Mycena metata]|uniref:DUF6589 domain-containing protein n=1 Tax=Mycena metata TaxID=1033252 RepID=A0AAD7MJW9_9AGAR|nr:hypothetical protein B0H16DRAFT_1794341 [Mycena metata]